MVLQSNYTSMDTPHFRKLSADQVERLLHASLGQPPGVKAALFRNRRAQLSRLINHHQERGTALADRRRGK